VAPRDHHVTAPTKAARGEALPARAHSELDETVIKRVADEVGA
jgi:hypothetical protein